MAQDSMERLSRRGLLTSGAGLALAGALPSAAQAPAGPPPRTLIDVHHHLLPPAYLKLKEDVVRKQSQGTEYVLEWTPQQSLDIMDKAGIRVAMASLSAPGVWFGDKAEARKLSRISNDYGAQFVSAHPDRFGFFASIPLPDIEGSIAEIDYGYDKLHTDGICLMTSYNGLYPGDPAFAKVFDALNRRKAVVYFHPTTPDCCSNTEPDIAATILEFPFDTTRAIASLLYSGTMARCPDIRFIFSHGGGALPALASRLARWVQLRPALAARVPNGPEFELKKLYFDTKDMTNPASFAALMVMAGPERILFGTDYPYGRVLPDLAQLHDRRLSEADMQAIGHGNAERLFPRLKMA